MLPNYINSPEQMCRFHLFVRNLEKQLLAVILGHVEALHSKCLQHPLLVCCQEAVQASIGRSSAAAEKLSVIELARIYR